MKRTVYGVALSLALLATGCGGGNEPTSALPQIDMNADYPEKEICLQDIAEVSYIAMETTDEMLYDGNLIEFSENGIVGRDLMNDRLLLFHPDGKARQLLSHKGKGPQEYTELGNVAVDWEREEIFVGHQGGKKMQVYTLDGMYKRTMEVNAELRSSDMYLLNDDHLLAFKQKFVSGGYNKPVDPYRPMVLISKADGTVDSLSHVKDYIASLSIANLSAQAYISLEVYVNSGRSLYLSDMGADTIYTIRKDGSLSPYLTRTPSVVTDTEGKYFLLLKGVSNRYNFLTRQSKTMELSSDLVARDELTHTLMHDRKTGEICQPHFKNRDCPTLDVDLNFVTGHDNTAHYPLQAFDLIEALEAGELSGDLKTLAQGLKADDNPVLMVVQFKE